MEVQYGIGVQPATASHPHPYVNPYITIGTQQGNTYPQRTPWMGANNMDYVKETRAPTVMSVGPNGPGAPTTVYVPHKHGIGIDDSIG